MSGPRFAGALAIVAFRSYEYFVPYGMEFDPAKQAIIMTNLQTGTALGEVEVISPAYQEVVDVVPLAWWGSFGLVYDPGRSDAFVMNYYSGTISVLAA